jgi:hypothetical protein
MQNIIKVTEVNKDTPTLIGVNQIISAQDCKLKDNGITTSCTEIKTIGAMVSTFFVYESVDSIYTMINN